ncbi:uncharacterized protein LOC123554299 [Mercenaria mercenaria]|uniref:uncharacterized protein LOC123554299 n=1 Tax=Mercenaria mercenaria TaxID=6596 RepID=UPI00234E3DD7|nr:uncharacterized protein LOC123554299 [Mercenaria mercenaria]XP_053404220.1 uncharacterized protein LOC123554299 [Mercenaria mercenaria]XP_053404221.1 uncharacterized protein LOC123554299 [Mercenaria mercenaria]
MSDRPEDLRKELETIVKFEYDVFVIFATEDEDLAKHVCEGLEQIQLRCIAQFKHDTFQIGQNVFDNVVSNVSRSNKTLLLLTEKSLNSHWVTLETILALEESKRSNMLRVRMLLHNVAERDIKFLKRGILASVPHIKVDFNKNEWNTLLAQEINSEISLPEVLPVGSMAHGLVFSHYTGFLCHVLPVLKEEIQKTNIYKKKHLHVSTKYYMLLPGTCNIRDDLTSYDEEENIKIEKQENLKFEKPHAGKKRTFSLSIYKISKGTEEFYFFADFPNVLKAMFRMENERLADVDIRFQIARFYFTMNEMINHAENEVCHNTVQLILFNENVESMQAALWHAVSHNVPAEVLEEMQGMHINQQPIQRLCERQSSNDKAERDATISCCDECLKDRHVADEIEEFLQNKGKYVETNPGVKSFDLPKAKWHIFVLSQEALETSYTLAKLCMAALADSLSDNALRVLVVIRELEPRNIPRFIKSVNMLKVSEPNYCEKLLKTMTGEVLRLEHSLPAGDVATGLAWAYVINYLVVTLLGTSSPETGHLNFRGRIQKFLKDHSIPNGCIYKMFILLPKSCTTATNLADKANEGVNAVNIKKGTGFVTKLGSIEPVVCNTGGQLNRPFYLQMYKHEDPRSQRSICFIAEYCTPANCMREMVENYKFAGLEEDEMAKQCDDFVEILPNIMQREAVKKRLGDISDLVELICYDDKTESLLSAIEDHIGKGSPDIVYAKDIPRTGDQNYHLP